MNMLVRSVAICFGVWSSSASAEILLTVDGNEYTLSALMENCQTLADDPTAQVACFNAVSALLEQQTAAPETSATTSVPEALETLRAVAQYEDGDSGLVIQGTDCNAQFLYYANYFHVSRRNVSSIDLFSTQLDVSQIDPVQTAQSAGMAKAVMQSGAVAATLGGEAISSADFGIAPKSSRMTIGEYAASVVDQLATAESSEFDIVLVHPAKQQSSNEIWSAFQAYVAACQQ